MVKSDEAAELEKASRDGSYQRATRRTRRRAWLVKIRRADQNNLAVVKQLALTYEQLEDWTTALFSVLQIGLTNFPAGDVALRNKANEIKDRAAEQYIKDVVKPPRLPIPTMPSSKHSSRRFKKSASPSDFRNASNG